MSNAVATLAPLADDDVLARLPGDELARCAHLLALSLAHHRAKFGVLPLNAAVSQAERDGAASPLVNGARQSIEEALGEIRRQDALRAPDAEPLAAAPCDESRRQMRISLNTPVKLAALDGGSPCTAMLRNISWGGASVCCDAAPAAVGESLRLLLPAGGSKTIDIEATVLRESCIDGEHEFGLRFESLDPADEERLLGVLNILMAEPDQDRRRSEARLVQRLEVEYGDAGEFRATLEDISASGLMLAVPDPLEIGQSLQIALSSADTPFALNLRARVVHQTVIESAGLDMYRVGLQFEHPSPRLREHVSAVIRELALMRPRELLDADHCALSATKPPLR